jgi:hypothetical protein
MFYVLYFQFIRPQPPKGGLKSHYLFATLQSLSRLVGRGWGAKFHPSGG